MNIKFNGQNFPFNFLQEVYGLSEHELAEYEQQFGEKDVKATLFYYIYTLPERTYQMIFKRYEDKETLKNISKEFNCSSELVRQILEKGNRLMRQRVPFEVLLKGLYITNQEKEQKEKEQNIALGKAEVFAEIKNNGLKYALEQHQNAYLKLPLADLDLSVRSFNCLRRAGIINIEDLTQMNAEQLGSVRNLGRKGYNEVIAKLHEVGLDIRKETL